MKVGVGLSTVRVLDDPKACEKREACGLWKPVEGSHDATIRLDMRLKGYKLAHTVVHEFIHQSQHLHCIEMSEADVDSMAGDLVEALFKSGIININTFERVLREKIKDK